MKTHRIGFRWRMLAVWTLGLLALALREAHADDWPQWRHDAGRSAATAEELAPQLQRLWTRQLPVAQPAWPKYPRMRFDSVYEPVVMGQTLFLPSMTTDSVVALDTRTGEERWRFYAEGPVRLAPVAWQDNVYFAADDGCLYCVSADEGQLRWRYRGLPPEVEDRKVIGNDRLISLWPARGGPVLRDGNIYFATGVWPFEGVYVFALEAKTGRLIWVNKETGEIENALLDHSTRKDGGLSPQGYLAAVGDKLLVPSGRAFAAALDLATGKLPAYSSKWGGRENLEKGSWYAAGIGEFFFQSGNQYRLADQSRVQIDPANYSKELGEFRELVLTPKLAYASLPINEQKGGSYRPEGTGYAGIVAWDFTQTPETVERKDSRNRPVKTNVFEPQWRLEANLKVHIKAGSRLYAGGENTVAAIALPREDRPAAIAWQAKVDGTPTRMIAADGKLFVVTDKSTLIAFGIGNAEQARVHRLATAKAAPSSTEADELVAMSSGFDGYIVVLGESNSVEALALRGSLPLIVVDDDAKRVRALRRRMDDLSVLRSRVAIHKADPLEYPFPPYLASMAIVSDRVAERLAGDRVAAERCYRLLRPYGGTAVFHGSEQRRAALAATFTPDALTNAKTVHRGSWFFVSRSGSLTHADDWSHVNANGAGTLVARDQRIVGPFGMLWFGGAIDSAFPQWDFTHRRTIAPLVAGGRMFFQVFPKLHCVDVYTGRMLWSADLPLPTDTRERVDVRFVAAPDRVYLLAGDKCHVLRASSGEPLMKIHCPGDGAWNDVRLMGDRLVAQSGNGLHCLDRTSGQPLWSYEAKHRIGAFCVGGDKVFCADVQLPDRRGEVTEARGELVALSTESGEEQWRDALELVPSRHPVLMAYADSTDLLVVVYKTASGFRGRDGERLWKDKTLGAENDQPLLFPNRIVGQKGLVLDPLSGETLADSQIGTPLAQRRRGCTRAVGSEYLMTLRDAHAAYMDLKTEKFVPLRGIRAGCTNSLIPANGLITVPNFSHGCSCNYSLFASFALVPLGDVE